MREGRRPEKERDRRDLTGAFAGKTADPLLRTDLASEVVHEYAIVTHGGQIADEDPTPVFERELHNGCSTVVLGYDPRPRARN